MEDLNNYIIIYIIIEYRILKDLLEIKLLLLVRKDLLNNQELN